MWNVFFGNALWQLILTTDALSRGVLLILLGMSITCWTIFFYKIILLRMKKEHMSRALAELRMIHTLPEIINLSARMTKTVPGHFLAHNLTFLKSLLQRREQGSPVGNEAELVQHHVQQNFDELLYQEEMYMPFLYACAGVATLIGLFGTVWGLIHSFVRISELQSADITTVAPGIAEALLTTLSGLLVAIPAYLMYHYLSVQIRRLEHNLSLFVDRYYVVIKQLLVQ